MERKSLIDTLLVGEWIPTFQNPRHHRNTYRCRARPHSGNALRAWLFEGVATGAADDYRGWPANRHALCFISDRASAMVSPIFTMHDVRKSRSLTSWANRDISFALRYAAYFRY